MNKVKLVVILTVLVDLIGVGIVIPSLPLHVQNLGVSPTMITLLFSTYSLFSFLSNPILGSISDRIGRRPVLIISILSTSIGWFIFAVAKSLPLLFLARVVDGIAAGNISTAQSCLVDLAKDKKERTHNLGIIGAVFGIGFIIGPAIGGLLSGISTNAPFWFAGSLSFLNVILAVIFLPETIKVRNKLPLQLNPLVPIFKAVADKKLLSTYIAWLLFGLAVSAAHSIFSSYLNTVYSLSAFVIGAIVSGQGVVMALNQAVALKHFWLKRFKQADLELYLFLLFGLTYSLMIVRSLWITLIVLFLSSLIQPIIRVVVTSQAMGGAEPYRKGEVLGIMASVASLGMVFGPMISGPVFEVHHSWPFLMSAILLVVAFFIVYCNRRKISQIKPKDEIENDLIIQI